MQQSSLESLYMSQEGLAALQVSRRDLQPFCCFVRDFLFACRRCLNLSSGMRRRTLSHGLTMVLLWLRCPICSHFRNPTRNLLTTIFLSRFHHFPPFPISNQKDHTMGTCPPSLSLPPFSIQHYNLQIHTCWTGFARAAAHFVPAAQ